MRKKFLSIVTGLLVLFVAVGCGSDGSADRPEDREVSQNVTTITVSMVEKKSNKISFQKVSLEIDSMVLRVLDGNRQIVGKPFIKDSLGNWSVRVNGLAKNINLDFIVDGFNSVNQHIYSGKASKVLGNGSNSIAIGLVQDSTNVDTNSLPSIEALNSYKDGANNIKVAFKIKNSNNLNIQWRILDKNSKSLSSEFSLNQSSTNIDGQEFIVDYNPTTNSNNSYLLELTTDDGVLNYTFSVTFEENQVNLSIGLAPIPSKLKLTVEDSNLLLTTLTEGSTLTYNWTIINGNSSVGTIDDQTLKSISISSYTDESDFKIRLTLTDSLTGASSTVIYHIEGNYSSTLVTEPNGGTCATQLFTVKLTSVLSILDVVENLEKECDLVVIGKENLTGQIIDVQMNNATLTEFFSKIFDFRYIFTLEKNILTIYSSKDGGKCVAQLFTTQLTSANSVLGSVENIANECDLIVVGKENITGQIEDIKFHNATLKEFLDGILNKRYIYTLGGVILTIYPKNSSNSKVEAFD